MSPLTPQQVKTFRYHAGLSLRQLAKLLHCSWVTVWRWETGQRQVSERFAVTLAFMAAHRHAGRVCSHCQGSGFEPSKL